MDRPRAVLRSGAHRARRQPQRPRRRRARGSNGVKTGHTNERRLRARRRGGAQRRRARERRARRPERGGARRRHAGAAALRLQPYRRVAALPAGPRTVGGREGRYHGDRRSRRATSCRPSARAGALARGAAAGRSRRYRGASRARGLGRRARWSGPSWRAARPLVRSRLSSRRARCSRFVSRLKRCDPVGRALLLLLAFLAPVTAR